MNENSTGDGFMREINELVREVETWGDSIERRFKREHAERLKGYAMRSADIEHRIIAMGSPAYGGELKRVFRIRANLETLIRAAEGRLIDDAHMTEALETCRLTLVLLDPEEQRAVLTILMAEAAASQGDPF